MRLAVKLHIRVSPNAKQSAVLGWEAHPIYGRVLRLRIAAPPIDGAANKAVIALLAKELRCPQSQLAIDKGSSSREKTVIVPDALIFPPEWL
jgi:uncharacterized protein (TIGR00251 family)